MGVRLNRVDKLFIDWFPHYDVLVKHSFETMYHVIYDINNQTQSIKLRKRIF